MLLLPNSSIETGTKSFTIKNEKGLPVPSDQIKSNTFSEETGIYHLLEKYNFQDKK